MSKRPVIPPLSKPLNAVSEEPVDASVGDFDILLNAYDASLGEEVATVVINEIFDASCKMMVDRHLERLARPFTVQSITNELVDTIRATFIGQDSGAIRPIGWAMNEAEHAPKRTPVDYGARGCLEMVKMQAPPTQVSPAPPAMQSAPRRRPPQSSVSPASSQSTTVRPTQRAAERGHMSRSTSPPVASHASEAAAAPPRDTTNEDPSTAEYYRSLDDQVMRQSTIAQRYERLSQQMANHPAHKGDYIVDGISGQVVRVSRVSPSAGDEESHDERGPERKNKPRQERDQSKGSAGGVAFSISDKPIATGAPPQPAVDKGGSMVKAASPSKRRPPATDPMLPFRKPELGDGGHRMQIHVSASAGVATSGDCGQSSTTWTSASGKPSWGDLMRMRESDRIGNDEKAPVRMTTSEAKKLRN